EFWDTVTVIAEEVLIAPREICEFYDVPSYEKDFLDNTDLIVFRDIGMDDVVKYLFKRRKEKMDVLASLKRKEQAKARQGTSTSTEEKLDGMIRWMQETSPVLQEFTQQHGLKAPNYPLDMFGPM
ncbi:hypothetical protein Gohar_028120, partial [Gossypium harknessii]|nr:hypothetical protein [Gossypium harknessii]